MIGARKINSLRSWTQVRQYGKETVGSSDFMEAIFRARKLSVSSGQIPVLSGGERSCLSPIRSSIFYWILFHTTASSERGRNNFII